MLEVECTKHWQGEPMVFHVAQGNFDPYQKIYKAKNSCSTLFKPPLPWQKKETQLDNIVSTCCAMVFRENRGSVTPFKFHKCNFLMQDISHNQFDFLCLIKITNADKLQVLRFFQRIMVLSHLSSFINAILYNEIKFSVSDYHC